MVEGADSLLHGGLAVGTVGVDEVDVFEVQALQGSVDTLNNVLSGETQVVDRVLAKCTTPVDLSLKEKKKAPSVSSRSLGLHLLQLFLYVGRFAVPLWK